VLWRSRQPVSQKLCEKIEAYHVRIVRFAAGDAPGTAVEPAQGGRRVRAEMPKVMPQRPPGIMGVSPEAMEYNTSMGTAWIQGAIDH